MKYQLGMSNEFKPRTWVYHVFVHTVNHIRGEVASHVNYMYCMFSNMLVYLTNLASLFLYMCRF